jgi:anti-anti-sigma factor
MDVSTRLIADVLLIQVSGRIDFSNSKEFEEALLPKLADIPQGQGKALLDLGGLTYISSSGLRVLMLASKKVRSREGAIAVTALQPVVMEVFEISRFDKVFQVYGTVGEALDALSAEASAAYGGE